MFATIASLAVPLRKTDNRSARVGSVIALKQEQRTEGLGLACSFGNR